MWDILNKFHRLIEKEPKAHILLVSGTDAQAYYDYLKQYHLNPVQSFEDMKGKMVFLGRKIEIQESYEE